ncbi:integral membrane protein [Stemphylium lycopersici]|uniref:Integral membrane protein n=1 Tax=Stemphylium lycopersici TaxID=183478 RepID=A0A364MTL6_STELY|nr:integral membrane protein [Stemphylium lycopersici]
MSQTVTSIELVDYPETAIPAVTAKPSNSIKGNDAASIVEDVRPIHGLANTFSAEQRDGPGKVCVTLVSSMLSGVMTVTLPTVARELELAPSLLLWPISVHALTCGCTLLLLGSVADVIGSRPMYLVGCLLQSVFTLACGLSQSGMQLIVFRAFAGVSISFCLPSAVSIITNTFPEGKSRNIAFASMGGGQPIGFSFGLVLGGIFADTIGWRWGFYMSAITNTIVFVIGLLGLPKVDNKQPHVWSRLKNDIDWVGILFGSASLALLSYCFALISEEMEKVREPRTLGLLITAIALIPAFVLWVGRQEKLGRPAVIPNSLWRNRIFSIICIGVFITWGVFNAVESYHTLFFQDVQKLSAIQTSIRFLPGPVSGALANLAMGLIAHRVRADWAVSVGLFCTTVAGLLMCVIQPEWSYWACAFLSVFFNPVGADTMFTVSNLVITSVFPARTQGLAGGVFNTVAQIGKSRSLPAVKMLSGPPRAIPFVFIFLALGLIWWYLHVAPGAGSSLTSWDSGTAAKGNRPSLRGDPLDFGLPLRFSDGEGKAPGSNYSFKIVIPKTQKEDISWMAAEIPDAPLVVYEVDNPNAENKVPKNKGREAMVYLSYIIDNYDNLPDTSIFMHAHRHAWHNNMLLGLDAAQMIKRLNHERVARMGYMNVRCHHDPGCPDWIHMDRPGGDFDFFHKPEEIYWRKNIWEEIHPGAPIPPSLSGICCAQFAVSRQRIQEVPIERFIHYRKWLLTTGMDDQFSGRIFEYIWHYIFTGHEVHCPAMNTCYCDGYGICFGGLQKFNDYFKKQDARNDKFSEYDTYNKKEEEAKKDGKDPGFSDEEKKRIDVLRTEISAMDRELDELRDAAKKRGEDPKARKEETETYDSSHIWDYAPHND